MKKQFDKQNRPSKPFNKPKMTITSYSKEFESFEKLISELKELHPEFNNIFTYDNNSHPTDAAYDVLKYFENHNPNIVEREHLPMTISVSANKVTLKTNNFFAIEWTFKYTREGFYTDLVAMITTFTKEQNNDEDLNNMIVKLGEQSWNIVERPFKNNK